jgi:hypothetical protein
MAATLVRREAIVLALLPTSYIQMKQIILAFLLTAACRADVIFNNITGDISLGSVGVLVLPGLPPLLPTQSLSAAVQFTPTVNATVVDAKVFIAGSGNITASLFSDQGGIPFSNLETLGTLSITSSNPAIASVNPAATVDLEAGTPYWLVLSSPGLGSGVANWYGSAVPAPAVTSDVPVGSPVVWIPSAALQFAIDGTPVSAGSAPEPGAMGLVALGCAGCLAWARSRKAARSNPLAK